MKSSIASEVISEKIEQEHRKTTPAKPEKKSPSKDHRKMPSSQEERASQYYTLREENGMLKERLQEYETDIKKYAVSSIKQIEWPPA